MNAQFVLEILHAIESGARQVVKREPLGLGWGNVEFTLDDGTKVVIFEDEGAWDYVDSVVLPDGTALRFWETDKDRWKLVREYEPPQPVVEDVYHMAFDRI